MFTGLFKFKAAKSAAAGMIPVNMRPALGAMLLATSVLLSIGPMSCQRAADPSSETANGERQMPETTIALNHQSDREKGIPPIDRDIPDNIQTATFALG